MATEVQQGAQGIGPPITELGTFASNVSTYLDYSDQIVANGMFLSQNYGLFLFPDC